MPLIVLVWVVRRWLQIVLADASVGGGFFNGLLGPFDGLQQKIRFNATGDNGRAAYFMVVRDGRFVRE